MGERFEWIKIATSFSRSSKKVSTASTFQQWVEQATSSRRVQSLIYALARLATYSHEPEEISAKVVLTHLSLSLDGALYLDGGWQQLMNQLHQQALLYNTVVKTETTVTEVELNQDQLWEIKTNNGDLFITKYVIYTGPPQQLATITKQRLTCPFPSIKTIQGASYEIALSKLPHEKDLFGLDLNSALYYSVHSTYAKLTPNNEVVLHLFRYFHSNQEDKVSVKAELELFLNKFQPRWENHVITSQFLPTITVNQRLPQVGDDRLLLRQETKLRRFYLAGDWADPNFILAEGATNSGKKAALAIIQTERGGKYVD
ncbi:FAD-dependent oxidoreductase [Bacillus sp. JCM 19034]|uniref:FAD-dependent oxidoreductase n=1 Tax=Bacillus sp. JCM 19034 TaxID=1481928 RepID=UPI000782D312|nr:FAD-dependent oxidoreductase [Bacillus sp. JCM 19034]